MEFFNNWRITIGLWLFGSADKIQDVVYNLRVCNAV